MYLLSQPVTAYKLGEQDLIPSSGRTVLLQHI
jgi:hypothetical protein